MHTPHAIYTYSFFISGHVLLYTTAVLSHTTIIYLNFILSRSLFNFIFIIYRFASDDEAYTTCMWRREDKKKEKKIRITEVLPSFFFKYIFNENCRMHTLFFRKCASRWTTLWRLHAINMGVYPVYSVQWSASRFFSFRILPAGMAVHIIFSRHEYVILCFQANLYGMTWRVEIWMLHFRLCKNTRRRARNWL